MNLSQPTNVLVDAGLKGTALILLAIVATFLLRRASAAVRHRVWGLMFCALLLLPLFSYALPEWQVPILPPPVAEGVAPATVTVTEREPITSLSLPSEDRYIEG